MKKEKPSITGEPVKAMAQLKHRHHFRLDDATEAALEQICRYTFQTKSSMMRRYVQEGVARDAQSAAEQTRIVMEAAQVMATFKNS